MALIVPTSDGCCEEPWANVGKALPNAQRTVSAQHVSAQMTGISAESIMEAIQQTFVNKQCMQNTEDIK